MKYRVPIAAALLLVSVVYVMNREDSIGYNGVITTVYEEVKEVEDENVHGRLDIVSHYLLEHKGLANGEKTRREAAIYYSSHVVAYISLDFEKSCLDLATAFNAHPHTCDIP